MKARCATAARKLSAVEQNVLALRNWIDQSDKHNKGAANDLRASIAAVSVRLNGLEAHGPAALQPPVTEAPATEHHAAESSPPIWTGELQAPSAEHAAPAEAPSSIRNRSLLRSNAAADVPDYLAACAPGGQCFDRRHPYL
jgi:hypothetical protein